MAPQVLLTRQLTSVWSTNIWQNKNNGPHWSDERYIQVLPTKANTQSPPEQFCLFTHFWKVCKDAALDHPWAKARIPQFSATHSPSYIAHSSSFTTHGCSLAKKRSREEGKCSVMGGSKEASESFWNQAIFIYYIYSLLFLHVALNSIQGTPLSPH